MNKSAKIGVYSCLAIILGCGGAGTTVPQNLDATRLVGNWAGTWNNTTFGSSGPSASTISIDAPTMMLTFSLDLGGNVFGGGDPPAENFTGPISASGFNVSGMSALFGDLTLTVDSQGNLTGSGQNIASPNVSRADFSGTVTETTMNLNYVLQLKPNGTAQGTISFTKQ